MKRKARSPRQQEDLDKQLKELRSSFERNRAGLSGREVKMLEKLTTGSDLPLLDKITDKKSN
jgi:hypothetical protein